MASYIDFLDAAAAAGKPEAGASQRLCMPVHRNDAPTLDAQLDYSERIVARLTSDTGAEATARFLEATAKKEIESQRRRSKVDANGSQPSAVDLTASDDDDEDLSVPYGFWMRFMRDELHLTPSRNRKMRLKRALKVYAVRVHKGCRTRPAFRGFRDGTSKRSSGGSQNRTKAVGLGFALLQYFVDVVQRLQCRMDSQMMMAEARELRAELLRDVSGRWADSELPKLIGNAGHKWFERWRKRYNICHKVTGMKLKVAWRKIKNRVFVLLTNIFRLREWWRICIGDKPMRWLSVDQKPSWWNNVGLKKTWAKRGRRAPTVKENFAHTRSRYTILTAVPHGWKMTAHKDGVPKCAMLFKGKPNGKIKRKLLKNPLLKPWMKMQTQEEGSYRSEDMVDALNWMLPEAHSKEESIVVLLDWFSGHLTQEVEDAIRSKRPRVAFSWWRNHTIHPNQRHTSSCNVGTNASRIGKQNEGRDAT